MAMPKANKPKGMKIKGTDMSEPILQDVLDPTKTQNSVIRTV
ncbi:hypothetical protein [Streptomyces fodineus]|nr:hypothetical protein [Streptomyces fodineus]